MNEGHRLHHYGYLIYLYRHRCINRRTFIYLWQRATTW